MPLHHCVAALDTGFLLTYLRARVSPGSAEVVMGLNPPSSSSDSHGDGWQCSQVLLEPLSCLLPQLEWKVPCVVSTHPGSSSRSGCSANKPLTHVACPSGTLEPCAITASAWDRREIPLQGLQWSFLLQQTHKPSNSHCVSALPGILLVSQSFKLPSYFYLSAFTSG